MPHSYSRPGKHNPKNRYNDMSKKSLCSLPTVALPASWHSPSGLGENSQCTPSISAAPQADTSWRKRL